jgi:diguanylate cyclase (GGDEF)-like protein
MLENNYELDPERLSALADYEVMDTGPERVYDELVSLAALVCSAPYAALAFTDANRTWLKAKKGISVSEFNNDEIIGKPKEHARDEVLVIEDLQMDLQYYSNALVVRPPHFRSYASVQILSSGGHVIGSLWVADNVPRSFSDNQISALRSLASQFNQTLELRKRSIDLQRMNDGLRDLAVRDDLTGLFNRRGITLHAEQQLKKHRSRDTGRGLWVMLADLDGLKKINDAFGHHEGSAAIKAAGQILASCVRGSDILGRAGGDEFIGILVDTNDDIASRLPERIDFAFRRHNLETDKPFGLGISVGLVKVLQDDTSDISEIFRTADLAMYRDKRNRKQGRRVEHISGEIHLSGGSGPLHRS